MVFKTVDLSLENNELLSIIENNCSIAVAARNEIRNAERLHKEKNVEVNTVQKKEPVKIYIAKDKVDNEFEDKIKCFLQDYILLEEDFEADDLYDLLPSRNSYRYEDILLRLIAESVREIKELNEIAMQNDNSVEELDEIKRLIITEKRKISLLKGLLNKTQGEDHTVTEEKNSLILVPTTGGNIRVISELESMPSEYIPLFKELIDSIVDGTFKGLKGFNNNNTLNGVTEVKGNGVRVVFKRLSKKSYAIITAFIKRSTNDALYQETLRSKVADFRIIQDKLKDSINDEKFVKQNNLYVEELYNILNQGEKTPKDGKGGKTR